MKVVFMGTPDLAATILEAISNSRHTVTAVVTQADKPKGRGKELAAPPVKEAAQRLGVEVFQPERVRTDETIEKFRSFDADIFVVAAYGKILPAEILNIPKHGCINVHTSLLPAYRGAAPIQWAVINGDAETGVTIMQMDEGMDTGDILFTEKVAIAPDETGGSLFDQLAKTGAGLIVHALDEIEAGNVHPVKQDDAKATYTKMLHKDFGRIDFCLSAVEIERLIRGLDPWPGTYTKLHGKTLKIWKAAVADQRFSDPPGTVVSVTKDDFTVNTGNGALTVTELQLEGKKRMHTQDFLRGVRVEIGEKLG